MITLLFKKRGFSEDFKYDLVTKTGNVDNFINTIRSQLEITGFKSFVPSPRRFRPAIRSDLVSCVKAVAFLSLKTTKLQGLRVDVWGDSCEIGGVQVTRLAFGLLDVDISVQSTLGVFCYAGRSILF